MGVAFVEWGDWGWLFIVWGCRNFRLSAFLSFSNAMPLNPDPYFIRMGERNQSDAMFVICYLLFGISHITYHISQITNHKSQISSSSTKNGCETLSFRTRVIFFLVSIEFSIGAFFFLGRPWLAAVGSKNAG